MLWKVLTWFLIRDASDPTGNGDRFVLDLVKQAESTLLC